MGEGRQKSRDSVVPTPTSPAVILDLCLALRLLGPAVIIHAHCDRVAEACETACLRVEGEQGVDSLFLVGGLLNSLIVSRSSIDDARRLTDMAKKERRWD